MSIRGVDAQIMISRAPDFVKEANALNKGGERMQDFLAVQAKAEQDRVQSMIVKTDAAYKAELHLENEGGGGAAYEDSPGKKKKGKDAAPDLLDLGVGSEGHIIDIKL